MYKCIYTIIAYPSVSSQRKVVCVGEHARDDNDDHQHGFAFV